MEEKKRKYINQNISRKIPFQVIMLGVVSLFTDAASEMIYPLIPIYIAALGSGAILLGIIEGVAETTAAMLKLISGIISDRIGKRKALVLAGYSISTFARPFTGVISSAWQIVLVRMFDRVGKGIRTAPRDALIASSVDNTIRGKAYGFHRAMDHLGAVIGPVLAIISLLFITLSFNMTDTLTALRWTFLLSIAPGIIAVLVIVFFIKEVESDNQKSSKPFSFSLKEFDLNFKRYLFVLILFTLGNSPDAFLLFRVEETIRNSGAVINFVHNIKPLDDMLFRFGSPQHQTQLINLLFLPLIWSFFHIIKASFSTHLSALSDKIGRKATINIGWSIYAFVYISFALLVFLPSNIQFISTFILFAIYALFYAFSEGPEKALVADMVAEEKRGSAFGLYNFSIGLSSLPAGIIFGFLYSFFDSKFLGFGGTVAFGFGGVVALTAMLLLSFMVKVPIVKRTF